MPRYRFKWESIPADVLAELATELELADDPLVHLRRRYGARPTTQFVRDLWSTLRDGWLTRDVDSCAWVATELRAAGLGDITLSDDLRYLTSCRNAEQLRRTVLVAFHELGEIPPFGGTERLEPADSAGVTRRPAPGFDLDAAIDSAWTVFTDSLAALVAELGPNDSFILGLPTALDPAELVGVAPYVQILGTGKDYVRGEVSGNAYLDKRLALSDARQQALTTIGWTAPADDPGGEFPEGSANFVVELPRRAGRRLVAMTVSTIREVFDVPHPSFLETPGRSQPAQPPSSQPPSSQPPGDLRSRVEETLTAYFDHPVGHDEDGDIPIRAGSAMVFVHIAADAPVVELFSPLLLGVDGDALALERINRANRQIRFAKLTWSGGRVIANYELWCDPFVPELLLWAVGLMMNLADEMDDRLRPELGGRRFFEDVEAPLLPIDGEPGSMHPALATINQLAPNGAGLTAAQTARICAQDRELVLSLIAVCEGEAMQWRKTAADSQDPEQVRAGTAEADNWDGIADLLRAALREIVLG